MVMMMRQPQQHFSASDFGPNSANAAMNLPTQPVFATVDPNSVASQLPMAAFRTGPAPGNWGDKLNAASTPQTPLSKQHPFNGDSSWTCNMPPANSIQGTWPDTFSFSHNMPVSSAEQFPTMTVLSMESLPSMAMGMDSVPVLQTQKAGRGNLAVSSMDSFSTIAVPSMESLPAFSATSMESLASYSTPSADSLHPCQAPMNPQHAFAATPSASQVYAVKSQDALPHMAVMSMMSLPTMPEETNRGYASKSMEDLPAMKGKKRLGRKGIAPQTPQSKRSDAVPADRLAELRRAVSEKLRQPTSEMGKHMAQIKFVEPHSEKSTAGVPQVQSARMLSKAEVGPTPDFLSRGNTTGAPSGDFQKQQAADCTLDSKPEDDSVVAAEAKFDPELDPVLLELEGDDITKQRTALEWVVQSVWPLALTRRGSRILQRALEVGSPPDQVQILVSLEGHVQEAMRSPHGNYVIQKCVEVMAPERVQFILNELKGDAVATARHRFGCRIIQRLIEHCPQAQTQDLVAEVLTDVSALCRHQFGNFVIQHILQHGSNEHKHCIADVIHAEMIRLAKHRIASHVVSCAMVHCAPEDVKRLTKVVLSDAGQFADLSRREYGSFVVREVNRARRLHGESNASEA